MLAPFAPAYLAAEDRAQAFLPAHFADPAARRDAALRAAARGVAPGVVAALAEQDRDLPPSAARARNLEALATRGTAAVVTGQQVGLFLGPLYTVYKAATAVVTARALEAETGIRCVPIFWLQTEDHDFAEVDHCDLPQPAGDPLRLRLAPDPAERRSLGDRVLGDDVAGVVAALAEALGEAPHAAAIVALLERHYRPGRAPGRAFAGVLAELFADEGLVLLDPRHRMIAALAAPLLGTALLQHHAIDAALAERTRALTEAGFETQIAPRPDTSLCFFHDGAAAGPRYRLTHRDEGGWALPDGRRVPTSDALALLEQEPLRFSTSALQRPILQDRLLPTAAYVGGPGEIAYFAQLGPLYDLFDVPMPLIVPRARFRLLDDKTRALLGKLGLSADAAEVPRAELLRRVAAPPPPEAVEVAARLQAALEPHLAAIAALDPSLRDPVQKARASLERLSARLADQSALALTTRDRVAAERVDRLQRLLFPGGAPQERVYSLPWFAARSGARAVIERVLDAVVPFDPEPRDLDL
jgi:bacillithiol biosynthesis cysteine-adding enzyme BshC